MAICKECGKKYYSKECPACESQTTNDKKIKSFKEKNISEKKTNNPKIYRRQTNIRENTYKKSEESTYTNKKNKNFSIKILINKTMNLSFLIPIIIIVSLLSYKIFFYNPLIGEWKTHNRLTGNSKIVFKNNSIEENGITYKVKYDIENNRVIVTDPLGIGTIIKIKDENNLESNLAGIKTTYKRIK